MKNIDSPGSPWRPDLPLSWLSILLDSCLSVPRTFNPPASLTPSPSLISVPLPAIFVAIVTIPNSPACEIISASFSWYLALSTWCLIPFFFNNDEMYSDFSTLAVPTRTGWPLLCASITSSTIASYFPFAFLYIISCLSTLATGLFVGITITSKP